MYMCMCLIHGGYRRPSTCVSSPLQILRCLVTAVMEGKNDRSGQPGVLWTVLYNRATEMTQWYLAVCV